jgi:hypothetical protein
MVVTSDHSALTFNTPCIKEGTSMATHDSIGTTEVEYRDIPGFPGYRVGNDGSVWSKRIRVVRYGKRGWGRGIGDTWNRLSLFKSHNGYLTVGLRSDGVMSSWRVHRLVLLSFIGPCPLGMECCHNNGNRTDNRLNNLRWGTRSDNGSDRISHGNSPQGEKNPKCKLDEAKVIELRAAHRTGEFSYSDLGRRFGITKSVAHKIVKRLLWSHVDE